MGFFLGGVHRKKKCDKEEGHQKKEGVGGGHQKTKERWVIFLDYLTKDGLH